MPSRNMNHPTQIDKPSLHFFNERRCERTGQSGPCPHSEPQPNGGTNWNIKMLTVQHVEWRNGLAIVQLTRSSDMVINPRNTGIPGYGADPPSYHYRTLHTPPFLSRGESIGQVTAWFLRKPIFKTSWLVTSVFVTMTLELSLVLAVCGNPDSSWLLILVQYDSQSAAQGGWQRVRKLQPRAHCMW
ncbi:hypothetical protein BDN72DRAFT_882848 [Pluteus cervinus]|uniref:Uncharacterized protein n=1 Tax=Pluteus cervinus TaxID=181527 RepID=A0ACD3A854_9AGAR|nr:hypothetical protein BDN72DRAFT_882848 [Pluteus cervinus]